MSNLETRTGKADLSSSDEKSVAQRKAEARALRPVRNDPQAATKPSDFIKQQILEVDADGNDILPELETSTTPDAGPENEVARKNALADAKRQAAAEAKSAAIIEALEEQLAETVRNAEKVIDSLNETITELERKLMEQMSGVADEDEDDAPSAADIAAQKKKDATSQAKASAGKKK